MTLARLCILLVIAQATLGLHAAVNQWTGAIPLKPTSIRFHPRRPALMYLVGGGPYSTEDEGKTVTALNNGLPHAPTGFELDPSDPSILYAVTNQGFYRSLNAGRDWRPTLTWDYTWQEARLAIDPKNGQALYLVAIDGRIKKSLDRGKSWVELSFTEHASCLVVSPSVPQVLYAGTTEGNVWRSTDSGTDWDRLSDSAAHAGVQSLVVDPRNPDTVYRAGYSGQGGAKAPMEASLGHV